MSNVYCEKYSAKVEGEPGGLRQMWNLGGAVLGGCDGIHNEPDEGTGGGAAIWFLRDHPRERLTMKMGAER